MHKRLDITGHTFGKLTALSFNGLDLQGKSVWKCRCECGKSVLIRLRHLTSNHTQSCGCIPHGSKPKHGHTMNYSVSPTYRTWLNMKNRCCNPNDPWYVNYGGRGISICDRWLHSFESFVVDMGLRPLDKTIDRIDNNGNYTPTNCRWATKSEQQYNRRPRRSL